MPSKIIDTLLARNLYFLWWISVWWPHVGSREHRYLPCGSCYASLGIWCYTVCFLGNLCGLVDYFMANNVDSLSMVGNNCLPSCRIIGGVLDRHGLI